MSGLMKRGFGFAFGFPKKNGTPIVVTPPPPSGSAPSNTIPPVISGVPNPGQVLTCSTGSWDNSPTSFSYQWLRDGALISGAINATYPLGSTDGGHNISCIVAAGNSTGVSPPEPSNALLITIPVTPGFLGALSLSSNTVAEDATTGTFVANIVGTTSGSTLSLSDDADARFALLGTTLIVGSALADYENAQSHNITVVETLAGMANSPRPTTLTILVTNVLEVVLGTLTGTFSLAESAAAGAVAGTLSGKTVGSVLSLVNDASGRVALSGTAIVRGAVALNYESASSHSFTVREIHPDATNSPRDTTFTLSVTNVFEAATLGALTFSAPTFTQGSPSSGTIIGATAGSTITNSTLPLGLTIDGAARTWAWDGAGTAASSSFTLTETLADSSNSPRTSTINYTINAGSSSGLAAPSLGYPAPLATNPTTVQIKIPADFITTDVLKLARSASASMSSPTVLSHPLTDADIAAGTFSIGLSGVTLSGITYFQSYGARGGVDSTNKSNIVTWGDATAPVITTSATQNVTETIQLAIALTCTDSGGVPALISDGNSSGWHILGGPDRLQVQVAIVGGVATVQWWQNGSQSYATKQDQNLDNIYNFTVEAIDYGGNRGTQDISVVVNAADLTPTSFFFTDVNGATLSTVYTSNTITVAGLEPSFNVPATVVGGEYQKNGGSWTAAGSFTVQNGDTVALRVTSGAANSITSSSVLTIGTYTDTYSVATPGSGAKLVSTNGALKTQYNTVPSPFLSWIQTGNVGSPCVVAADRDAVQDFHLEVTADGFSSTGQTWSGFYDGTTPAFNTWLAAGTYPGANGGNAGITVKCVKNSSTATVYKNGSGSGSSMTLDGVWSVGDALIYEVVRSTQTVKIYHYRASTGTTGAVIGTHTLTSQTLSSWRFFSGGIVGTGTLSVSDAATINFGAQTNKMTPNSGFLYYA